MLVLYIFILMFTNSINKIQKNIHSTYLNRITIITLLISILFTFNTLYFQAIGKGISIYSGLFQTTVQSQLVEILLLIVGISILLGWPIVFSNSISKTPRLLTGEARSNFNMPTLNVSTVLSIRKSDQYSLIALFSILGGSLLMSSLDLLSMYLSIELQSFALYILATLNKERLSATSAGLKYFLLGSLSSCFILLGSAIIYSYTGLTQFEAINTLMSIPYSSLPLPLTLSPLAWEGLDTSPLLESVTNLASPAQIEPLTQGNLEQVILTSQGYANLSLALAPQAGEVNNLTYGLIEMLDIKKAFTIGLVIIVIGFLFKISAAPFYQWAPDVYDGVPTIVTVWLTILVKITIFIFLLGLFEFSSSQATVLSFDSLGSANQEMGTSALASAATSASALGNGEASLALSPTLLGLGEGGDAMNGYGWLDYGWKNLLLLSSLLSLLVGTIAGLSQIKVKRLLAFSSISHVGFLLLALGIYTQKSIDSFIFYLLQYSLTSLNIFLILLAFGYLIYSTSNHRLPLPVTIPSTGQWKSMPAPADRGSELGQEVGSTDVNYLLELKGQLFNHPVLSVSLAICLFSMAGIPPLIGFFSKQFVLFSSIENGNNFLSIVAILVSVISASYYLRLIKIAFFDSSSPTPSLASGFFIPDPSGKKKGRSSHPLTLAKDIGSVAPSLSQTQMERFEEERYSDVTNVHSYIISVLTFIILFFFLDPSIILNGTQLISLTIFNL